MCKASIAAERTVDAIVGDQLTVGIEPTHGFAAFHSPTVSAAECVTCVKNGERLTLTDIPTDIQAKFGIKDAAHVTFLDDGDNAHDFVRFDNGEETMLLHLADQGIGVYVGELELTGVPRPRREDAPASYERELEPA